MAGPTPTSPQSLLNVLGLCDNFRVDPTPAQTSFRSEKLVTWRLDSKPDSPAIGLLRAPIVEQLRADNANSNRTPWVFHAETASTAVSFADWVDTPAKRTRVMAETCTRWRDAGLFPTIIGPKKWRNEMYPIYRRPFGVRDAPRHAEDVDLAEDVEDDTLNYAFKMERAACALFGAVTYGVHMTAYVAAKDGWKVWVPMRARTKPTWPGYLDNTVAGGIASGYGVYETLAKEAMEEATIEEDLLKEHCRAVGSISYFFSTDAGWLQPEIEYLYDLRIPEGVDFQPKPSDGEVESFELLPLNEVIRRMRTCVFKANCGVALIDFLIRHGFITPDNEPDFQEIITRLHGRFEYERW